MENYAGTMSLTEKRGPKNPAWARPNKIVSTSLTKRFLRVLRAGLEYCFGIHIGAALGWIIGFCIGHLYANNFTPIHFDDPGQIRHYYLAQWTFSKAGILFGAVTGLIVIAMLEWINNKKS